MYLYRDDETLARHVEARHCVAIEGVAKVGSMFMGQFVSGYSAQSQAAIDAGQKARVQ